MEIPAMQVNSLRTGRSLCSYWPMLGSLSGLSLPLWALKQREETHNWDLSYSGEGFSYWKILLFWLTQWLTSEGCILLPSTHRLEPMIDSFGYSGDGWFWDTLKTFWRKCKNVLCDHINLTYPLLFPLSFPFSFFLFPFSFPFLSVCPVVNHHLTHVFWKYSSTPSCD